MSKLQILSVSTSCLLEDSFLESNHWAGEAPCGCSGQLSQLGPSQQPASMTSYGSKITSSRGDQAWPQSPSQVWSLSRGSPRLLEHKLVVPLPAVPDVLTPPPKSMGMIKKLGFFFFLQLRNSSSTTIVPDRTDSVPHSQNKTIIILHTNFAITQSEWFIFGW